MLRHLRTITKARPRFSAEGLEVQLPTAWRQLTQRQLRYVLTLLAMFTSTEAKTLVLFRLGNINVLRSGPRWHVCWIREKWWRRRFFRLTTEDVAAFTDHLDFIDTQCDVRLERIGLRKAADLKFGDVTLWDYLNIEYNYTRYLATREEKYVVRMARIMYRPVLGGSLARICRLNSLSKAEEVGTVMWFTYVKRAFAEMFPNLYRAGTTGGEMPTQQQLLDSINNQLRALTEGDLTKREAIKEMPCRTALTELDAKAREYAEFERMKAKNT